MTIRESLRAGLRTACSCNVGELDCCRHVLLRFEERREAIQPLVGDP